MELTSIPANACRHKGRGGESWRIGGSGCSAKSPVHVCIDGLTVGKAGGGGGAAAGRSARESGTVGGVAGERRARQDAGCATCTPCSIAQSQSSLPSYAKPASRQWLLFLAGLFAAFLHSCHIGRHEGTHAHTHVTHHALHSAVGPHSSQG